MRGVASQRGSCTREVPARAAGPGRRAGGCRRFALDDPWAPATSARPTTARFRSATSGGRRFAANRFCTNSPRLVVKIERWDCEAKAVDVETHDSGDSAQCERVEPQNPRIAHPSSGRLYCTAARLAGGRSEPCLTGPLGQRLAHSDAAARRATAHEEAQWSTTALPLTNNSGCTRRFIATSRSDQQTRPPETALHATASTMLFSAQQTSGTACCSHEPSGWPYRFRRRLGYIS